jgi:hypothetical protein
VKEIMSKLSLIAAAIVLSAGASIWAAAGEDAARVPVLLELFTSEGCSSCPPADRLLQYLDSKQPVAGADLIVLSEHVDYWDSSRWRDRFSSPQFSARQREYTNRYHLDGVYTPQLVVDGQFGLVGSDARAATSAIRQAIREPKIPIAISNVTRDGDRVTAHIDLPEAGQGFKGGQGILFVAIADNRAESQVRGGENKGRSLAHVAVMRILKQVGVIELDGASTKNVSLTIRRGADLTGLRFVAFVQDSRSGHVLGVAAQKI